MRKTAKSKLLQSFSRQPVLEVPSAYISLVDMGLIWRLASPTSDDCDAKTCSGTDYLWHDYLNKVCLMIYSRHNNATTIILINNNYTVVTSVKDGKHERQTATHTNLPNFYPKEAEKFPTPTQFKWIMLKSENKVWLQKLLKHWFKATAHVQQAKLIYCEWDVA